MTLANTQYQNAHRHDFQEVLFVRGGEGIHLLNGVESRLLPGTFHLIKDKDVHDLRAMRGRRLTIENIAFSCATWKFVTQRYLPHHEDWFSAPDERRSFPLPKGRAAGIENAVRLLSLGDHSRLAVENFLLQLLIILPRIQTAAPLLDIPSWLLRAHREIALEERFLRGPQEFTRLAGRSPEHVCRVTKALWGKTPTDLVNEARIHRAAQILKKDDRPITAVAQACGFANMTHFYRLFQTCHGCTPAGYRRSRHGIPVQ